LPSKRAVQRFQDVIYNVDAIRRYTARMRRAKFFADDKTRDATLHCLLRISEAAKKLGKTAEELAPDQSWRQIRDLGNRLRHEYDAIDRDRIWVIVSDELAPLRAACVQAIKSLQA
jgi:uncharacterized protein with HEPN domain